MSPAASAFASEPEPQRETEALSSAQRYQLAQQRTQDSKTDFGAFRETLDFTLDDFQVSACRSLLDGKGVLVAAPTGAGKTIVGEFAVYLALTHGKKAFYTTPIKALSNQKFTELAASYGAENVGLLTGDTAVNSSAPIVVMTTEVLRNMLYAGSEALVNLGYVVMDEVHYLADRFRGAVWEEVIIHLPASVQLVSLSATVSNAEEFGAWLDTVRGSTDVVVSEHRPVPLWQHVMVGRDIVDLFAGELSFDQLDASRVPKVNNELLRLARTESSQRARNGFAKGRPRNRRGPVRSDRDNPAVAKPANRAQVIKALDDADLLPAITFIFSRAGCDAAVRQCVDWGINLTTDVERSIIAARVDEISAEIPTNDLQVLGFYSWRDGLLRGIAAHHAGLLPTFKEAVEDLFARGLIRAVFATETLALGVNMPARSVVLEKLEKFNGETHTNITAGEYTQLTGRAGRRGIDVEGHAVVLWQPGTDPSAVAGLASRRTYPLNSSFQPTYNMSINLIAQFGSSRAREILQNSFAQFQADRSVVGLARAVRSREESLAGYAESMTCHLGDFTEYSRLRRELSDLESSAAKRNSRARRGALEDSLADLKVGDVIPVGAGRDAGFGVVISQQPNAREPRPNLLTDDRRTLRLNWHDLAEPVNPVSWVKVPKGFDARVAKDRKDLASVLRQAVAKAPGAKRAKGFGSPAEDEAATKIAVLRAQIRNHPCHGCSERESHARWAERWWKLKTETDSLMRQIQSRTGTIAKTFDRVVSLLQAQGFVQGDPLEPTPDGERLRRIYGDKDLLIALCLRHGAIDDLDANELAAVASTLVYQAKREMQGFRPKMPSPQLESAVDTLIKQWSVLEDAEEQYSLPRTGEPDLGLVWPVHKWARGKSLAVVLEGTDLAAGDFVRWVKQVIDVLDQLAGIPGVTPNLRKRALAAIERIRRGVVGYSAILD